MNLKEFLSKETNLEESKQEVVKKVEPIVLSSTDVNHETLKKEDPVKQEQPKQVQKKEKVEDVEKLFIESETNPQYKDKWIEIYEKAKKSRKKNYVVEKILRGRFTIRGDESKPVILPDIVTYNKSSKDLIKELGG